MERFVACLGIVIVASLAGCASGPIPYQDSHSLAYNVALNGGVEQERLHDVTLTKEQATHLADTVGFRSLDTAMSFALPGAGLTNWQAGGGAALGLVTSMLKSQIDQAADRVILMAWMPKSMASNSMVARNHFAGIVRTAMEGAIHDVGLTWSKSSPDIENDKKKNRTYYFLSGEEKGWNCPVSDPDGKYVDNIACSVYSNIVLPSSVSSPTLPGVKSGQSYLFGFHDSGKYAFFTPDTWDSIHASAVYASSSVDTGQFLQAVSKHLPKWVYIYVPANEVEQDGEKVKFPFVLHQGKALLFAVEK